jgi:hypothetical protein
LFRQAFKPKEIEMEMERKYLTQVAKKNGGMLMVDQVIELARDENNILHKHFTWDDSKAADAFRKQEARALIQRCRIKLVEHDPVEVRAFVSLPTDRENGGGYRLTTRVLGDEGLKDELLRDIKLTIQRWNKKLHLLDQDLADLLLAVEEKLESKATEEHRTAA